MNKNLKGVGLDTYEILDIPFSKAIRFIVSNYTIFEYNKTYVQLPDFSFEVSAALEEAIQ